MKIIKLLAFKVFRATKQLKKKMMEIERSLAENYQFPDKKIYLFIIQKSGTHLINKIMNDAGFEGIPTGENCKLDDFRGLKHNQYLWSSFPPSLEIRRALERGDNSVYIIYIYRDPRDVLVSWFYFNHPEMGGNIHRYHKYVRAVNDGLTDDERISNIIKIDKIDKDEYNPIEHIRLSRYLLYHPKVLDVRFEDLIGSQGGGDDELQINTIKNLFKYLGAENINSKKIADNCFDKASPTFRKGIIGNYVNDLSQKQIKLFNQLHGDILKQYGYHSDIL